jgi:hypothetical protein
MLEDEINQFKNKIPLEKVNSAKKKRRKKSQGNLCYFQND